MIRFFSAVIILPLLMISLTARAALPFVVGDIRIQGLQRVSAASVFTAIPVNVGDSVNTEQVSELVRRLFYTGNFDDIQVGYDQDILVISVVERPSISEINIDGNKAIKTEALLKGLKRSGLAEGNVFKRPTLENMRLELTRQYVSQGRYDAHIDTEVISLPRNRVGVNINIDEGSTAAIKHINFVGNQVFDDQTLLDLLELKTTGFWSWLFSDDKYSKEALSGDIETLTSHYMDRGYIEFSVDSTQVTVTPDKDAVYITVNISEGDIYKLGELSLSGDLVIEEQLLKPFIFVKTGQVFSQASVTAIEELLVKRLGNDGYNFAKVQTITSLDKENLTVDLKFFIDPGKRTYVNRVRFEGNNKTADDVLRREMRQFEAAPASSARIEQSRVRLDRLGYFKETKVDTIEVPGKDDLIDLLYTVEEQPSGSIGASVGYSQDNGIIFGANIQQDNFLGSGKKIGLSVNKSSYLTNVRFNYTNPYYTEDGVSRGYTVYYRVADLGEINVSNYTTNTLGGAVNFSYPIKETERVGFSFGYSNTEIEAGFGAVQEIIASPRVTDSYGSSLYDSYYEAAEVSTQNNPTTGADVLVYSNTETVVPLDLNDPAQAALLKPTEPGFIDLYGDTFDDYTVTASWNQSTLNRGRMATRGASQSVALEVTVPGSDMEFFKLSYNGQLFLPITNSWIVRLRTELGFGDGLGDVEELPFFQNFYSGGFGSVRGYRSNTLGPRSTPADIYTVNAAVTEVYTTTDQEVIDGDRLEGEAKDVNRDGNGNAIGSLIVPRIDLDGDGTFETLGTQFASRSVDYDPDPFGGNLLVEGSIELLFPLPFIKDHSSVRSAFYVDAGNVFSTNCRDTQLNCTNFDADELRYSAGVGLTWVTGFGPLTFSYSKPLNENEYDETENFQFSLGRSF